MACAAAPVGELAVQLSAPASSLAVPPPAASTAEAVGICQQGPRSLRIRDLMLVLLLLPLLVASTRARFLPDSRCLLIFIYITVGSAAAAAVQ